MGLPDWAGCRRGGIDRLPFRDQRSLYEGMIRMAEERSALLMGSAAVLVGGLQVVTIVQRVLSPDDSLTLMHALQLMVCGSLLWTGALSLFTVWRRHHHRDHDSP